MSDDSWTWGSVIDALGGTKGLAEALSQRVSTVSGWRDRGIPGGHWAEIKRVAVEKGRPDISLDVLANLAAVRPESREARR